MRKLPCFSTVVVHENQSYDENYGGEGEGDKAGFYVHVKDSNNRKRTLHFSYDYSSWEGIYFDTTYLDEAHWSDSRQAWVSGPETLETIAEDELALLETLAGLRARKEELEKMN